MIESGLIDRAAGGRLATQTADNGSAPIEVQDPSAGSRCAATIDLERAAAIDWDVLVIGAGPGGALAARQLALDGMRCLLLDKSPFPRSKVCGGCISGLGTHLLEQLGLGTLVDEPAAIVLRRLELASGGKRVSLPLRSGAVVSRFRFDAALVRQAVAAGADFLPEVSAAVCGLLDRGRFRGVRLLSLSRHSVRAHGRVILAADGLGRTSLGRHGPFSARIAPESKVGLGATLSAIDWDEPAGLVSMSVGHDGYVGITKGPGETCNIAAALDPHALRKQGPAGAVRDLLAQAGVASPRSLDRAIWRGTGLLTRHSRRLAAKRLLLLGDAAGYVEPFTGEGMTWAMLSAVSAANLVGEWLCREETSGRSEAAYDRRAVADLAAAWKRRHRAQIAGRQRSCRALAWLLRHPSAVRAAMGVIGRVPAIATPFVRYFWSDSGRVKQGFDDSSPARRATEPASAAKPKDT